MKKVNSWLWKRFARYRLPLAVMIVGNVAQALLGVAFAIGSKRVIDEAVNGNRETFIRAVILQLVIILSMIVVQAFLRHLRDVLDAKMDRSWKKRLMHVLLRGEFSQVKAYHSGELVNRMNNDVRVVDEGILSILPGLAWMIAKLLAAIWMLLQMHPALGITMAAVGLVGAVLNSVLRMKLKSVHKQVSTADGRVSAFIQESMEKLLMVQAMDLSDEMERRADDLMGQRYQLQRRRKNLGLAASTGISFLMHFSSFVALVWCAFGLFQGNVSFGELTAVTQLVSQLQNPFMRLSGFFPQYVAMQAAAERLMELDQLEISDDGAVDVGAVYEKMTCLGARELRFAYDREQILDGAEFTVPKGTFSVITGPSGMGKSTLLKLLLGIIHPEQGTVYAQLGDSEIPVDRSTRRMFAYVPQGNLIFSGTIRENLLVTCPDAGEDAIVQALYVSGMDEFLSGMPKGLDTLLGEDGAGLSEGQLQRLAIARAILGGAPILLLDEATSALDEETERCVLERIRAMGDRTCIAVTHRPAALAVADIQLDMVNGQVILR